MDAETIKDINVRQAVPFFAVAEMERSLRYYIDGLGFEMKNKWTPEGKIEWCWLEAGGAAIMLQEYSKLGHGAFSPQGKLGEGVSICFICSDALKIYRDAVSEGLAVSEPFVGNNYWVVGFSDPDGYRLEFESSTDVPEGTTYTEWEAMKT